MRRLASVLLILALAPPALAIDDDLHDTLVEDPKSFGRTPDELFEQFDNFFTDKLWLQACARLDRLRELNTSLKKRKDRAGYAYIRCAVIHLKTGNLSRTDSALELSKELIGDHPDRKPVEADLHRLLAKKALESRDLGQALAHFELAAAKHLEKKKEEDASLQLTKYARAAFDDGRTQEAKDAVDAALNYYPENREAGRLQDQLGFWGKAGWVLAGLGVLAVLGILYVTLRRKPEGSGMDPYDPRTRVEDPWLCSLKSPANLLARKNPTAQTRQTQRRSARISSVRPSSPRWAPSTPLTRKPRPSSPAWSAWAACHGMKARACSRTCGSLWNSAAMKWKRRSRPPLARP